MSAQFKLPFEIKFSAKAKGLDQISPSSARKESLVGVDFAMLRKNPASISALAGKRPMRLRLIGVFSLLWVGVLVARMYSLQISDFETWQEWAIKQHVADVEVASERGPVVDRNGKLVAVSVPAESIYIRPRQIKDKQRVTKELSKALGIKPALVGEKIVSKQPFVWVKRQLHRHEAQKITELNLPGVGSVLESRRFYPYNNAASALIGKVGVDGVGLSGIESLYEKQLREEHVKTRAGRDAFGKIIHTGITEPDQPFSPPKGNEVRLTIDADLQIIMDEELELGRKEANAKQAMAVMIDSDTGEIIALSQSPSHNFNNPSKSSKNELRNLLVEAVFEPGSVMKPMVAAAAVDAGVVSASEMINCENGRFPFSKHTIKDVHPSGVISFHDVVVRSSNIGMTKVGIRMGSERLYSYLRKFGFGQSSKLGLPGESAGILRAEPGWSKVDVATHAFGQGVAVTPLQVVRAVAAIANGGILPQLSVVIDEAGLPKGSRIVSEKAAVAAREMMYGVVEDEHGTGSKAVIPGIRVGGKTGTAQKASPTGRGYQAGMYIASFVGFADGTPMGVSRNLTTMVVIDEPHAKSIYGGTLAAPVFQKVMERSFRFLATKNQLGVSSPREPMIVPNEPIEVNDDELFTASYVSGKASKGSSTSRTAAAADTFKVRSITKESDE
ncbi:MAG: peptidoglycan D,D-transpeptidase FtsI family protein [Pseudomonadota bacterium]